MTLSYRSRWNWNPDRWGVDVEHLYAGEDFNPEMGFHRRSEGFRRSHGKFEFSPRPKNMRGVRKVAYSVDVDYFEDAHGGRVQSRDQQALFRVDFESGDVAQVDSVRTYEAIVAPFLVAKDVRIPAGSYDYTVSRASYTFGSQRKVSGTASTRFGSFYGGDLHELSWRGRMEFSPQIYAEPTITWNTIDGPWGEGPQQPGEQPPHLHRVAADVPVRARAVPVAHRFGLDQRALPVGIPARQRTVCRLQRRAEHADARNPGHSEPKLRHQGHAPVPAVDAFGPIIAPSSTGRVCYES